MPVFESDFKNSSFSVMAHVRRADPPHDGLPFSRACFRYRMNRPPVLVTPGNEIKELFEGKDFFPRQEFRNLRTDPFCLPDRLRQEPGIVQNILRSGRMPVCGANTPVVFDQRLHPGNQAQPFFKKRPPLRRVKPGILPETIREHGRDPCKFVPFLRRRLPLHRFFKPFQEGAQGCFKVFDRHQPCWVEACCKSKRRLHFFQ